MVFTTPDYYPASQVIPFLALAIALSSMYIFAPGLGIAKKTKHIAVISIITALVNTALNFTFIPFLGNRGAAFATLISSLLAFSAYMIMSQKLYYVPHKWADIIMATVVAMIFALLGLGFGELMPLSFIGAIIGKVFLVSCSTLLIAYFLIGAQEMKTLTRKLALQVRS
jgi:peptidoglycan biosynthesis protein MviN/MurJ (putative lipid II flippase)